MKGQRSDQIKPKPSLISHEWEARADLVFACNRTLGALQNLPKSKLRDDMIAEILDLFAHEDMQMHILKCEQERDKAITDQTRLKIENERLLHESQQRSRDRVPNVTHPEVICVGVGKKWIVVAFLAGWFFAMVSGG